MVQQQEEKVLVAIKEERKVLPRLGTRKLHYLLQQKGITCGRDKLFKLLREEKMLILPPRRYVQTTNSRHWLRRYPNIAKEATITAPEQLWVSDITYLKTTEGTCYLNLVTDAWSRKIVGYAVEDNMEADSMIAAYQMALKEKQNKQVSTIHHSDRGLQYCSGVYVSLSEEYKCRISMTENGDPYENALAERMNRTLKEEFGLGGTIKTRQQALQLVKEAIYLYNHKRPHTSLNYQTPEQVHTKIPDKKISYQGSS